MIDSARLQGQWCRNWITTPGVEDRTTRVHWLQAGPWFADLRVPLLRPGVTAAASLAALAPADLAGLLSAEGFAGRITLAGDICTWHRTWNWRGFPCAVDAGKLWFDAGGCLIEEGVHADYREEWRTVPGPPWRADVVECGETDGMLLRNAEGFLLALGQRGAASWPRLAQDLRDGLAKTADAAQAFASVYVLGHWVGGAGIADLSTQPFCEGRAVLTAGADAARLVLPDFEGREVVRTLRLTPLCTE